MLKGLLAALLLATGTGAMAQGSGDASDLWWNPAESGWGVNISQQGDMVFATLFVYGASRQPVWYVASAMARTGASTFSGPLYETQGPPFAAASFDPSQVGVREVGTATLALQGPHQATLTYSVDGATVTKSITRQSFRPNDIGGTYLGAFVGTYSACAGTGIDGYREEVADIVVTQTGTAVEIEARFQNETCRYTGTYAQSGRSGRIDGRVDCGTGDIGAFTATEVIANGLVLGVQANAEYRSCRWSGRLGGVRIDS